MRLMAYTCNQLRNNVQSPGNAIDIYMTLDYMIGIWPGNAIDIYMTLDYMIGIWPCSAVHVYLFDIYKHYKK